MLNANLYVHPSHIENSSNSICEAMLLGMPIIATYAGGTPSILGDKNEGLLVQDGDPYALAKSLGSKARVKSFIRNDKEKIVKDVINIYASILSDKY